MYLAVKDTIYMITPQYLRHGDKIGIVATARKVSKEELQPAIDAFESWGLEVVLGDNLFSSENQYSGSDAQRVQDLQSMLDNPEIKAVISGRGGYGTVRIVDHIDFTNFEKSPKWIIGYSDITVLHSHIHNNFGIETLHAIMPINFTNDDTSQEAAESLRTALFGDKLEYFVHADSNYHPIQRNGEAQGQLIGGNLSLIYALTGSASDIDTHGKILFIEDLDEYLYHLDRMMVNLERSGKLSGLAALVVGGMSDMKDNTVPFGKTAEEIIFDAVKKYKFPVCFGFPAGHIKDNKALILGRNVKVFIGDVVSIHF